MPLGRTFEVVQVVDGCFSGSAKDSLALVQLRRVMRGLSNDWMPSHVPVCLAPIVLELEWNCCTKSGVRVRQFGRWN